MELPVSEEDHADCTAVRTIAINYRDFFIDYRLTLSFIYCLSLVAFMHHIKTKAVQRRFKAYPYLSTQAVEQLWTRLCQLVLGVILAIPGYSFLLFQWYTGCNASEIYILVFGTALALFDFMEILLQWPLPPALVMHHLAVSSLAVAIGDWRIIPAQPDQEMPWQLVLLLANMGMIWISDFFHAVYRTNDSLAFIKMFKGLYMALAIVRVISFLQLAAFAFSFYENNSLGSFVLGCFVALAYGYIAAKAVRFVYNLDCDKYYKEHQAVWKLKSI